MHKFNSETKSIIFGTRLNLCFKKKKLSNHWLEIHTSKPVRPFILLMLLFFFGPVESEITFVEKLDEP